MNEEQAALWGRIQAFPLDDPGAAYPFTARLARENGWTRGFARRVAEEYKRFAFLSVAAGHPCSPGEEVDEAWHLHLLYSRNYWEDFCGRVLRHPLHHNPTRGGAGELAKHTDWYARTVESYRLFFSEPPADLWPAPGSRFHTTRELRKVDPATHWILPKPAWWGVKTTLTATATAAGAAAGCARIADGPIPLLDWTGPEFLSFYGAAFVLTGAYALWRQARARGKVAARAAALTLPDDVYAIAALAGGPERAAQAAVIRLAKAGAVILSGTEGKELSVAGPLPEGAHRVEQVVFDAITAAQPVRPLRAVAMAASHPTLREVAWSGPEESREGPATSPGGLWPMTILFLLGCVKVAIGVSRDRPVSFLVCALVVTLVVRIVLQRRAKAPRSVRQALLARIRAQHGRVGTMEWRHSPAAAAEEWALAVGLLGVSALDATPFADYGPLLDPSSSPRPAAPKAGTGAWDAGGCSGGGSGGGDGGGGGGGGDGGGASGCGGCSSGGH